MKITLVSNVVAGQPTANGRIYTKEALEEAVKQAKKNKTTLLVHSPTTEEEYSQQLVRTVIGLVEGIHVDEQGVLSADVEVIDTWRGAKFKQAYEANPDRMEFAPAGYGKIVNGKVVEFELKYFSVGPKDGG